MIFGLLRRGFGGHEKNNTEGMKRIDISGIFDIIYLTGQPEGERISPDPANN